MNDIKPITEIVKDGMEDFGLGAFSGSPTIALVSGSTNLKANGFYTVIEGTGKLDDPTTRYENGYGYYFVVEEPAGGSFVYALYSDTDSKLNATAAGASGDEYLWEVGMPGAGILKDATVIQAEVFQIFISEEQERPVRSVTLTQYQSSDQFYGDKENSGSFFSQRIQVRVRSSNYIESYERIRHINDWLKGFIFTTSIHGSDTAEHYGTEVISGPSELGRDESRNYIWVASYELLWVDHSDT